MADAIPLIMEQFLGWLADRPRTYANVMESWRTSCPRLSVWEDATLDGLVAFTDDGHGVVLTAKGRAALDQARSPCGPMLKAAE